MNNFLTNPRRPFSNLFPFALGFDSLFSDFEDFFNDNVTVSTNSTRHPPYNIIKMDENKYRLEFAVAGWKKEYLSVKVQDNLLTVSGEKTKEESSGTNEVSLYHGTASRSFKRTFTLSPNAQVTGADLKDGMLTVFFENIIPEHKKERLITIE